MLQSNVIHLTQQALWYVLLLSAPPILVAAVVGLLIAFVQADHRGHHDRRRRQQQHVPQRLLRQLNDVAVKHGSAPAGATRR